MTILASVNGKSLHSPDRRKLAFSFFNRNKFDTVYKQETHFTSKMDLQIQCEWEGVAVLFSSRLEYNVIQVRRDNEGRILNILLNMDEHTMNFVNV